MDQMCRKLRVKPMLKSTNIATSSRRSWVVWSIALASVSLAILQGLGRVLEPIDPLLATYVDPTNVDARVRSLARELGAENSDETLGGVEREAKSALLYDPIDARLSSILGEVSQRRGATEEAYAYFRQAQSLSKTELLSVQSLIALSLRRGDVGSAVQDVDTLLRRWPDRFGDVASFFIPVLQDETGYAAVLQSLQRDAPWRGNLVRYLAGDRLGLDVLQELLGDLAASLVPARPAELAAVISGLMRQGQYDLAYRFFLSTLSSEERAQVGYVYNPSFAPIRLGRPFDWQVANRAGVELRFAGAGESGAYVRFLNAPVKEAGLRQSLVLPPGAFRLSIDASAVGLVLPKGLFWKVSCGPSRPVQVAKLDILEGSYQDRRFDVSFTIPDAGCILQQLQLSTEMMAESWRFLYQGELILHAVRIEKASQ
jgi:hypothetical protein